jgi:SAM-dependent methyltransferase
MNDWLDNGREEYLDNYQDAHDNSLIKLNLGSGPVNLTGWINCDIDKQYNVDKHFDMNKFPYPFKAGYADQILLSHVLEHLDNPVKVMNELWRISKPGALVEIRVPHWSHFTAYGDLTHQHYFSSYIFKQEKGYYSKCNFKLEKLKFTCFRRHPIKIIDFFLNLNPAFTEIFICKFFPVSEMTICLRVSK